MTRHNRDSNQSISMFRWTVGATVVVRIEAMNNWLDVEKSLAISAPRLQDCEYWHLDHVRLGEV